MSQFAIFRIGLIGMHRGARKSLDLPSHATFSDASLARKADICARILAEAHRLVRMGQLGAPLNQLVFRACELLDDLDEVLVALHPARNRVDFAAAAALHRELEQIQAAIPDQNRGRPSASRAGPSVG